ncbi:MULTISPECIES: biotin transporter BioY [Rhodobacterales]|jgi:biotin transport system substrate-specific component|uniref:Biotin transporter n=1 Tax=Sulfitobacter porphyrae TaxID=1246864 RepID=A0ABW2BBW9_9RHOB|nr:MULTISPECIES: biotin transporter BioY [Roseobacteraceae]MAM25497.1 biotin transporter BioY [Paracoccaceae bacterium]GLT12487.1 biotin biosynthesis protein BioY [Sulfitobacter porphyrae]KZX96704.1 biotin transporter BioY [Sulfitobacter sp. HI0021]KZY03884.1 biotin transporter BioY [Sulfitobacter sp. HI0027]KZZ01801.1 biotin transporter BioY [Sulfitobacter sp. HI0076]|tara:strand:- start:43 stop:609 length:567 start_codon:yes stop_codon:yes gene_type:complete
MNLEATQRQPFARLTREISIILIGTILLTLSAKIAVPFYPVPMSTQTLVVLGLGLFLGPVRSSLVVVAYLLEGLFGLPVFAGTPPAPAGLAYFAGPTGGFLIGFALAAAAAGWMVQKLAGLPPSIRASVAVLSGSILMYCAGLFWLGGFVGYGEKLLNAGLYPFLLGDLTKAAIAVVLYTGFHNRGHA